MEPMPRATSYGVITSLNRILTGYGQRLHFTRLPVSLNSSVVQAFPRTSNFKEDILQAFYDGIKHKPKTTFGNVKADVLADKDPHFQCGNNFCNVIRNSFWHG
jgi:hypothetical protein